MKTLTQPIRQHEHRLSLSLFVKSYLKIEGWRCKLLAKSRLGRAPLSWVRRVLSPELPSHYMNASKNEVLIHSVDRGSYTFISSSSRTAHYTYTGGIAGKKMRKGKLSRSDGSELRSPLELKVSCQCEIGKTLSYRESARGH